LKLNKKLTINEIVEIYKEVGYYMPYQRVRDHVSYSVYKEAITKLIKLGIPNARWWFSNQKYLLKLQEVEQYEVALIYGKV
jgi:hypothetical protein